MCATLRTDRGKLDLKKVIIKCILMVAISLVSVALMGQLIAQLFSLARFYKVTAKIKATDVEKTGYYRNSKWGKNTSTYSLVLILINGQSYYVSLNDDPYWTMKDRLHKGDLVTIYLPSTLYQVLRLDGFRLSHNVSQLEFNHQVLYSLKQQKQQAWYLILLLMLVLLCLSYSLANRQYRDSSVADD